MNVCSISTSWRSAEIKEGLPLLEAMKETGMKMLELEFRLLGSAFDEIKSNIESSGIGISSLHAVCPSTATDGKVRAERFLISDEDEDKRKAGVGDVLKTIRNTAELSAKAVVLHCGRVDMEEPIYKMMKLFDAGLINSDESRDELHKALLARMSNGKKSFQSMLKSLDEINGTADKLGIKVGLENRYYFSEMPNLEEIGIILNRFEGGALYYWHDTGHAHVQESLFGVAQELLLETFGGQILGIHLHDVKGGYTDHNAPGSGDIDFDMVNRYLELCEIRVMELNRRVTLKEAVKGIEFLCEKGIFS